MSKKHDQYQKVRLEPEVVKRVKVRLKSMQCPPSFTSYVNWMLSQHMDSHSMANDVCAKMGM